MPGDSLLTSQFQQDSWVLQLHPQPGVYLDIGCNDAHLLSNTFALDRKGWMGWCIGERKMSRFSIAHAPFS